MDMMSSGLRAIAAILVVPGRAWPGVAWQILAMSVASLLSRLVIGLVGSLASLVLLWSNAPPV